MQKESKQYRIQPFHTEEDGVKVKRFLIIAANGKTVAKCNTYIFAQYCAQAIEEKNAREGKRLVGRQRV